MGSVIMLSNSTAGLIFYGLALIALVWLIFLLRRVAKVRTWPVVSGTILESSVETDADSNSYPRVRYTYRLNGKEFESDRILPLGEIASTGGYSARVVARYPIGAVVKVYVNPMNSIDSALENTIPALIPVMLTTAVAVFFLIGSVVRG